MSNLLLVTYIRKGDKRKVAKSDVSAIMMTNCDAYGLSRPQHLPHVQSTSGPHEYPIQAVDNTAYVSTKHGRCEPLANDDLYEISDLDEGAYEVIPH